jgi:hypothetical protein
MKKHFVAHPPYHDDRMKEFWLPLDAPPEPPEDVT